MEGKFECSTVQKKWISRQIDLRDCNLKFCLLFAEHANQVYTGEFTDIDSIKRIEKNAWNALQQAESEVEEFVNGLPPITFEVCDWL